jgi:hypothetical protein
MHLKLSCLKIGRMTACLLSGGLMPLLMLAQAAPPQAVDSFTGHPVWPSSAI